MGLIKAGLGAAGGMLADQWKEYFYCEALSADVLVAKGTKRVSARSSNHKASENIISSGSLIAVSDGQCMLIVEQGKVVEVSAEPGEFIFDASTEPSIFNGKLGEGILNTFKTMGKRFAFGGDTGKDQRVYYINTKEIVGNKYGTATPVPFRVVDRNIGLDMDIAIRCNGEYSYRICDPILFYTNVTGNVGEEYRRDQIDSMLRTELLTALQPSFAKISELGVRYSMLPAHTAEIADALNRELSEKWEKLRGLRVASFGISSVSASQEDEERIKQLQSAAVMRDPTMGAAALVGAQADAMRAAAANEGGAMMGFMGLGMAQQAGGANAQNLYAFGASKQQESREWRCSCGTHNLGNFCSNCGKKKPDGSAFRCNKCGWEPQDPGNPPKFCPNCGDPFNDADKK